MRTFTVTNSDIKISGGRYKSENPSDAAKKAASKLFAKTNAKSIKFELRETTRGSKKNLYHYIATQEKLKNPVTRTIKFNGVEKQIQNLFKINLKVVT
jgi:hypothetical protein